MPIGFPLLSPELVHSRKTYIFTVFKEIFPLNEFEVPKPFSLLHTYDFRSWWDNFHHVLKIDNYAYCGVVDRDSTVCDFSSSYGLISSHFSLFLLGKGGIQQSKTDRA